MDWEEKGMRTKMDGKPLNKLRFADDVVLVGKSKEEIQKMMQSFDEQSREAGLECSIGKTKLMSNRVGEGVVKIKIGNEEAEVVDSLKYIGKRLSFEEGTAKELSKKEKKLCGMLLEPENRF